MYLICETLLKRKVFPGGLYIVISAGSAGAQSHRMNAMVQCLDVGTLGNRNLCGLGKVDEEVNEDG
jgi:hypothetical protein